MRIIRQVDAFLGRVEFVLLVVFLTAMVLLAFLQVVLRNFFDTGLLWADTIVRHLVIWGGFTAAAIASSEGRHISIDALTKFLPDKLRRAAQVITGLFAVVVCWFLAEAAWKFLMDEKAAGSDLVLGIQTWVALLIIPIGYLLMGFHFIVKVIDSAFSPTPAKEG